MTTQLPNNRYTPKVTMCLLEYFFRLSVISTIDEAITYFWGSGYPGKQPPRFLIGMVKNRVDHGKFQRRCAQLNNPS